MPSKAPLINEETLQKLIKALKIQSLEELMAYINNIEFSNKESFQDSTNLDDAQLQTIGIDDKELYNGKELWIDSINQAITKQSNKQDTAVVIPQYGPVMKVCGKDTQETIKSILEYYREVTGEGADIKIYQNKEEFLAANENKNLPEDIKQTLSQGGFPLKIYTLKFESRQKNLEFQKKIENLIKSKKLIHLGGEPARSPQPNLTPVEQETSQQAGASSINPQPGPSTSSATPSFRP